MGNMPANPGDSGFWLPGGRLVPERLLQFNYARSSGPGGQNVNKVSTKVQLRVSLADLAPILGPAATRRLRRLAGRRITAEGELLLIDDATRSQHVNRQTCVERLRELLVIALSPPPPRIATHPSPGSHRRRAASKERRAVLKRQRRRPSESD
jgi:ribosome-associated protein